MLKDCMLPNVSPASAESKPKLLDEVRGVIRFKHFSLRTEQTYVDWIVSCLRSYPFGQPKG